jgi:hypothetical protein
MKLPNPLDQESQNKPLKRWSEKNVAEWISQLGASKKWEQYGKLCVSKGLDGFTLLHANIQALLDFGFSR